MTTTAIPEEIIPSSLLAVPGATDYYTVSSGIAPNGDDALTWTSDASTAALTRNTKAYQPASASTHLLSQTENSMSLWIRRRSSFSFSTSQSTTSSGTSVLAALAMIMGVGDALATTPNANSLRWGMWAQSAAAIQFGVRASTSSAMFCSNPVTIATNTWHLLVVNADVHSESDANRGAWNMYLDGVPVSNIVPTPTSGYFFRPSLSGAVSSMRFALGDPTQGKSATQVSATNTPFLDIAKLTFHNRKMTTEDMLAMLESMYYGGAAA